MGSHLPSPWRLQKRRWWRAPRASLLRVAEGKLAPAEDNRQPGVVAKTAAANSGRSVMRMRMLWYLSRLVTLLH
jgi:hypothetical protein